MSRTELLEEIGELSVIEQVALAEAILHGLSDRLGKQSPSERAALRMQMAAAVPEAAAYYQTDRDVALWREVEGEPYHEHETGTDLARGPGADAGG
jgi:hypothetical protein